MTPFGNDARFKITLLLMIRRITLIILACACHSSCTSTLTPTITTDKPATPLEVAQRVEWLTGKWYGDQPTQTGGRRQWIMDRNTDGTFYVQFKVTEDTVENFEEKGTWGVCGKYEATKTDGYGGNAYLWDVYEITLLTEKDFHYRNVETGNQYQVKKVPNEFTFPR
jgi:hypothetical protein